MIVKKLIVVTAAVALLSGSLAACDASNDAGRKPDGLSTSVPPPPDGRSPDARKLSNPGSRAKQALGAISGLRVARASSSCDYRPLKFNKEREEYVPPSALQPFMVPGWVRWRVAPDITVRDNCDYGLMVGKISVYSLDVLKKHGTVWLELLVQRTADGPWESARIYLKYRNTVSGWDTYDVPFNSVVRLPSKIFTGIKVHSYLRFNGTSGQHWWLDCTRSPLGYSCS